MVAIAGWASCFRQGMDTDGYIAFGMQHAKSKELEKGSPQIG